MINFNSAIFVANELYGIDSNIDDLEEIGLIAWEKINSKLLKLYRYSSEIDCGSMSIELPCNFERLEAVTATYEDWQSTSNKHTFGDLSSNINEAYNEMLKINKDPLYSSGKFVKFEQLGNTLYFTQNYGRINILYYGSYVDDEGLPYITEKQSHAIACYIAYTKMYKEGIMTKNGNIINIAKDLQNEWKRLCSASRVSTYITQNEMNEILDAKTSWNRKLYGKSLKPLR